MEERPDPPDHPGDAGEAGNLVDKSNLRGLERRIQARFLERVTDMVGRVPATSVLDVGCGEGWPLEQMARRYPDRAFVGVDVESPKLKQYWSKIESGRISFMVGDVNALPVTRADEFDMVTALEILEHLDDPDAAMREIRRVCPDGWLVASVPWEVPWRIGNLLRGRYVGHGGNTPGHLTHWWTPKRFRRFLEPHGRVEEVCTCMPWTIALVQLAPIQPAD